MIVKIKRYLLLISIWAHLNVKEIKIHKVQIAKRSKSSIPSILLNSQGFWQIFKVPFWLFYQKAKPWPSLFGWDRWIFRLEWLRGSDLEQNQNWSFQRILQSKLDSIFSLRLHNHRLLWCVFKTNWKDRMDLSWLLRS